MNPQRSILTMTFKAGDAVAGSLPPDPRGFVTRFRGVVVYVDNEGAAPSMLVVLQPTWTRVEHPCAPHLGREIPSGGELAIEPDALAHYRGA